MVGNESEKRTYEQTDGQDGGAEEGLPRTPVHLEDDPEKMDLWTQVNDRGLPDQVLATTPLNVMTVAPRVTRAARTGARGGDGCPGRPVLQNARNERVRKEGNRSNRGRSRTLARPPLETGEDDQDTHCKSPPVIEPLFRLSSNRTT